jgi:predicted metal-dependent enzyme (double-stranded beta helix superfamily)
MARLFYKPFGLLFSVLGGIVAGAIFKRVWRVAADEEEAPQATDRRMGWGEVVAAAAAEGAVFAGVKALIDRAGAIGFERVTGAWPGDT